MSLKKVLVLAFFLFLGISVKAQIDCDSTLLSINGVYFKDGYATQKFVRNIKSINLADRTLKIKNFNVTHVQRGSHQTLLNKGQKLNKNIRKMLKYVKPGECLYIGSFIFTDEKLSDISCPKYDMRLIIINDNKRTVIMY